MDRPFNPLIDDLPETFEGKSGTVYQIRSDLRQVLKYLQRIEEPGTTEVQKRLLGIRLLFAPESAGIPKEDLAGLVEALSEFMSCGRAPVTKSWGAPVFDLLHDGGLVLAAFMQAYQINLRQVRIHWWVFCELLGALPGGTRLAEVIDIRAKPLPTGQTPADAKERQRLIQLKARYKIGATTKKADPMGDAFAFLKGVAQ